MPSKTMIFVIALMIVIACLTILFLFKILPVYGGVNCIQGQYDEIDRINDLLKKAKDTGEEFVEPFHMKSCARCIWFNSTDSTLRVIFLEETNPVVIPVDVGWGASNVFNSKDKALNVPGFTYRFHITRLGIIECFNCDEHVGKCGVE